MTKRCEFLYDCFAGISKDSAVACSGEKSKDCIKSRGKFKVTQKCWQVESRSERGEKA